MKKNLWKLLLAGLVTGVLVFAMSLTAGGSESLAATSTRWPTSTRRPTETRWPTSTRRPTSTRWVPGPTNTRQPSATPTATKTRLPTITRPGISTRWPTIPPTPTQTRWPSRTPSPTRTRISSPTPTPIVPSGWQAYQNPIYGFQFSYPGDASITAQEDNHVQIYMTITTGTNLVSKYLEVYAREDSGDCGGTYGGTTSTYVVINGYTFLREEGRDQGAGQIHEWVSYSTAQGRTCITFSFILHSGNPDNYSPPIPLFDKAAESAIFAQIMGTFGMLPATPIPTITPTPSITPTEQASIGPYGVVYVRSNDVLNIRSGAGTGFPITGMFSFYENNIYRTGPSTVAGGATWVQVQNPSGGIGWVNSYYLAEFVPGSTFCTDSRFASLIAQLTQAVNNSDGSLFASLVSPTHGIDVRFWHYAAPIHYSTAQAVSVFTSTTSQNWGGGPSGNPTVGTFADVIQPALTEVLDASYGSYCNDPKAASMFPQTWPDMYVNFNYYSLLKPGTPGVDLDYAQWMVGIDYVNGQPYLAVLIHVVWEP